MRPKNKRIYLDPKRGRDIAWMKETEKDYRSLGFDTELKDGILTVFAVPRKRAKKKDDRRTRSK